MAYSADTAELVSRNPLVVKFVDGANSHNEQIKGTIRDQEGLRRAVKARVDALNDKDTISKLALGIVGQPTPVPIDTVQETFLSNDRKLTAALRAVDKGLLQANDPRIVSIQSDMAAAIASRPALVFLIS